MRHIVLISGRICNGKSALADRLSHDYNYEIVRSRDVVAKLCSEVDYEIDRLRFQELGRNLDQEHDGKWLYNHVLERHDALSSDRSIVVDTVLNESQVEPFRVDSRWHVEHVHLYAPIEELKKRYEKRVNKKGRLAQDLTFEDADPIKQPSDVEFLKSDADVRINTSRTDVEDTLVRVAARIGVYSDPTDRCVDVLIGGQYGSEGKGHVASYLAPEYDILVRVGGPNAGHTVLSDQGEFVFHHLPSGSLSSKAKILIGPGALINVPRFLDEVRKSGVEAERIFVDPQAMTISSEDIEKERDSIVGSIASTGQGVGAALARKIEGRGAKDGKPEAIVQLARDVPELNRFVGHDEPYRGKTRTLLETAYANGSSILLEGTQGSGLSLHHGFYPHVTSRDTNVAGCLAEAGIAPSRVRRIILVVRSHPIRVGDPEESGATSGFLKNETDLKRVAKYAQLDLDELETHEITSTTKRKRRVGMFDWELFRRSCQLNCPTDIALTFADYLSVDNRKARRFEQLVEPTIKLIEEIEKVAQAPVSLINTRFPRGSEIMDRRSIIDRRAWISKHARLRNAR